MKKVCTEQSAVLLLPDKGNMHDISSANSIIIGRASEKCGDCSSVSDKVEFTHTRSMFQMEFVPRGATDTRMEIWSVFHIS